ncbi:MAG: lysyl oxidase family protein [Pirellulales bacterium]
MPRSIRNYHRTCKFERLERRALLDGNSLVSIANAKADADDDALATPSAASQGGGSVADVLPDLIALASASNDWIHGWSLDTAEQPGHTLLRLTTAVGNAGDGAMEIRGGAVLPSGSQEVYQRIYNDMGGFRDVLAGTFTHHPGHGHTHFDGFAQYHLREVTAGNGVGDIVVSGDKTSFCLLDTEEFEPSAGPAEYETCTTTRQGISSGWADIYDQSLPDQWIDITSVADGTYWLEVVVDPDNHILEANESNNAERILIELGGGSGLGDRFEENNTPETATDLGFVGDRSEADLSIHQTGDTDYFQIRAADDGTIDISIFFSHSLGDIDMGVYDGNFTFVDESTSTSNMENIVLSVLAGETYYIEVYAFSGDTNPNYELEIDGPGSGSLADVFEPNDTFGTAYDLGVMGEFSASGLSIHASGNDDYYLITAAETGDIDIDLFFSHDSGDIDLEVYDENQSLVDDSTSSNDTEHVTIAAIQGETYYLRVYGFEGETNPEYELTIGGLEPGGDAFEPNNSFTAAYDLGIVGDFSASGLSIHAPGNEDYYKITAADDGNIEILISFLHAQGDIDLAVFSASETLVASSDSTTDDEFVSIAAMRGETYYVNVYGFGDDINPAYEMTITGPPLPLQGDYNSDGSVDAADYVIWRKTLNSNVTPHTGADGDGDGAVDQDDYGVWTANFGDTATTGSGSSIARGTADADLAVVEERIMHSPVPLTDAALALSGSSTLVAKQKVNTGTKSAAISIRDQFSDELLLAQRHLSPQRDGREDGSLTMIGLPDSSAEADEQSSGSVLTVIDSAFDAFVGVRRQSLPSESESR